MTKTITKFGAALYYIRRGWPIFPVYEPGVNWKCSCGNSQCEHPAKHPRTSHGVLDAITNEAQIRGWWDKWPKANIALATGKRSGVIVLDVDVRHGGDKSLAQIEAEEGGPLKTLESLTGGGGRHLFFLYPGSPVKNKVGVMPGLDIRGDNGYVLLPPSVHISGRVYLWKKSN